MSEDRPGSGVPAGGLSEEQVIRLLGAAGPVEPTPPQVVSRLDAVLADLVAQRSDRGLGTAPQAQPEQADPEQADPGHTGAAVSLDAERSRRRRTWGPRLLVAAAVLGVAGIGLSVADDLTGGSGSDSASAGSASEAQVESGEAGGSNDPSGSRGSSEEPGSAGGAGGNRDQRDGDVDAPRPERASETARAPRVPRVLRITDDADLRAAVRATGTGDVAALTDGYEERAGALDARNQVRSGRCVAPAGRGRRSVVSYQGDPATLVVRRSGDRLDGRVYDCDLGLLLDGVEIGPAGE